MHLKLKIPANSLMVRNIFLAGTLARAENLEHDTAFQRAAHRGQGGGSPPSGVSAKDLSLQEGHAPLGENGVVIGRLRLPQGRLTDGPRSCPGVGLSWGLSG